MTHGSSQYLRVLEDSYVIERVDDVQQALDRSWIALVRAPEGLTVVRVVESKESAEGNVWNALYSGGTAHGLDEPGMLVRLLNPLAEGNIPVFVTSTYDADLILVPRHRLAVSASILRAAGHYVDAPGHQD